MDHGFHPWCRYSGGFSVYEQLPTKHTNTQRYRLADNRAECKNGDKVQTNRTGLNERGCVRSNESRLKELQRQKTRASVLPSQSRIVRWGCINWNEA